MQFHLRVLSCRDILTLWCPPACFVHGCLLQCYLHHKKEMEQSVRGWLNELWLSHIMKCHAVVEKKELNLHLLKKVSVTCCYLKKGQVTEELFIKMSNRKWLLVVASGSGEARGLGGDITELHILYNNSNNLGYLLLPAHHARGTLNRDMACLTQSSQLPSQVGAFIIPPPSTEEIK